MTDRGEKQQLWSADECAIAADLWRRRVVDVYGDQRLPNRAVPRVLQEIAGQIGRTFAAVEARYRIHGGTFGIYRGAGPRMLASAYAIADRDARYAARMRQDATARAFGDPPPGFSALDRRGVKK